jgi:hypothetical protein
MKIMSKLIKLFILAAAALLGNWAGEQLRFMVTGQREHELRFTQPGPGGEPVIAVNPLLSNFLPGLAAGILMGQGRTWNAFLVGLAASAFLGDQYEQDLLNYLKPKQG